jgi:hypothetical protein
MNENAKVMHLGCSSGVTHFWQAVYKTKVGKRKRNDTERKVSEIFFWGISGGGVRKKFIDRC